MGTNAHHTANRGRERHMNDIDHARLTHAGNRIRKARTKLSEEMAEAKRIALDALKSGATEAEVARLLGVDRMTIRKWEGKR
jgi:DNA-binding transcriptional regulator YiaG